MSATSELKSFLDPVNDTIVNVKQAAKHYSVSVPTVWRWLLSGKVASMKVGSSRRTSIEAIARAFAS
ncbi:MAG: helix-turn-helix domain-containing protein [Pirellulaceae bacterium]|jgi:excisionase family DNA binding protein|nr:helix-turn-helix domain-containing protein [Pirellulaceae bacterium]